MVDPHRHLEGDLLQRQPARRRAHLFDACLAQLDSDAYRDGMRRRYREKQGILSPFVHWEALDEALLEQARAHESALLGALEVPEQAALKRLLAKLARHV